MVIRIGLCVTLLAAVAMASVRCKTEEEAGSSSKRLQFKLRQDDRWSRKDEPLVSRLAWESGFDFPWRGTVKIPALHAAPGKPWPVEFDLEVNIKSLAARPGLVEALYVTLVGDQVNDSKGRTTTLATNSVSSSFTTSGVPLAFYYPGRTPVGALGDREGSLFEGVAPFPVSQWQGKDSARLKGRLDLKLPADLPAGHYKPHVELYARVKGSRTPISLGRLGFMLKFRNRFLHTRPGWKLRKYLGQSEAATMDFMDNPMVLPRVKVGQPAPPRVPWVIFHRDEFFGMSGLLSQEDQRHHGMLQRAKLPTAYRIKPGVYRVEPGLPTLTPMSSLAGMFITPTGPELIKHYFVPGGNVRAALRAPGGKVQELGEQRIIAYSKEGAHLSGGGFPLQLTRTGDYELRMTGVMQDRFGRPYKGGGTYRFTVAMPLSFSSAAKPGTNYLAGSRYPAVMHINPAVPAEVRYEVEYFPASDPARRRHVVHRGTATRYGHFVPKDPFLPMNEPGEYYSRYEARYRDAAGKLWMGAQTSAGVVAPREGAVVLHGGFRYPDGKGASRKNYGGVARYRDHREAPFANMDDPNFGGLQFPIPYHSGDTLFATVTYPFEHAVPNFLSMEIKEPALARRVVEAYNPGGEPYNFPLISTKGTVRYLPEMVRYAEGTYRVSASSPNQLPIISANRRGISPVLYPEQNQFEAYAYLGIVRPGVQVLTIAFTGSYTQPYWDISPSREKYLKTRPNGDLPGDIYRIMGGLVLKDLERGKTYYDAYAVAMVNTSRGKGNSALAPGERPIYEVGGRKHYYFMGMDTSSRFTVGEPMVLAGTVMPPVAVDVAFMVTKPDGQQEILRGRSNRLGQFSPPRLIMVDQPGLYRVRCKVGKDGRYGDILGSGDGEFYHFALPDDAPRLLRVEMSPVMKVDPSRDIPIKLSWPDDLKDVKLHYSMNMPGFVLDEGSRQPRGDRFSYPLSVKDLAIRFPVIELQDFRNGGPAYADVIVFVALLEGTRKGERVYDSATVILRNSMMLNARALLASRHGGSLFPSDRTFFASPVTREAAAPPAPQDSSPDAAP